ncbi:MAG: hypothetical protein K5841_07690 [Fretibacterium sp.]|nr:hypothetical protein [Fretibacterium sp.]
MNENVFLEKMKDILDNETVTISTALSDIEEWDSVSMLGYVAIALELGKNVSAEQVRACVSMADLYALLN